MKNKLPLLLSLAVLLLVGCGKKESSPALLPREKSTVQPRIDTPSPDIPAPPGAAGRTVAGNSRVSSSGGDFDWESREPEPEEPSDVNGGSPEW